MKIQVCSLDYPKLYYEKTKVKKATTPKAKRNTHADEYNTLMMNRGAEAGTPFSIKTKFELDQKIQHAKFGAGFVKNVLADRVEVMFEDELKTLIHNKI